MSGNLTVGSISYAAHSGLGHLMRDFYRHGVVQKVLILQHRRYPNFTDWYPAEDSFTPDTYQEFLSKIDVLLLFENAHQWHIAKVARRRGIPIALIPNYEYTPFPPNVIPDLFICASLLDVDYYSRWPTAFLPIPVNTTKIPWRLRERALTFVHNAGHGGHGYREGTPDLLQAMKYVQSPVRLIVRGQPEEGRMRRLLHRGFDDSRVEIHMREHAGEEDLWTTGDAYVAPQKFNGMSLPLQEAFAAGMLVITTNRYPMNTWLPTEPMIPVARYEKDRIAVEFERAVVEPQAIAAQIDAWHGRDIVEYSLRGKSWAEEHDWERLKPRYLELLGSLLK